MLVIGVCLVFLLIELSDLLDGHAARVRNQESELGKVLDPFADSLSRLTYFVAFAGIGNPSRVDSAHPDLSRRFRRLYQGDGFGAECAPSGSAGKGRMR